MRTQRTIYGWVAGAAFAMVWLGTPSRAVAMSISCDFSSPGVLGNFYAQARDTFGLWTKKDANGRLVACSTAYAPGCWQWTQEVWPFRSHNKVGLHVESMVYNHYHLGFNNPKLDTLNICFVDPGDGYGAGFGWPENGGCHKPDWGSEPRKVYGHDSSEVIDIWVEGAVLTVNGWISTGAKQFDLTSLMNASTSAINLWVLWSDGNWYVDGPIPAGTRDESAWAYSITEAQIVSAQPGAPPAIDNIVTANITP